MRVFNTVFTRKKKEKKIVGPCIGRPMFFSTLELDPLSIGDLLINSA